MTAADAQQFKAVNDKLQSANMKVALKIAPDKGVGLFSNMTSLSLLRFSFKAKGTFNL